MRPVLRADRPAAMAVGEAGVERQQRLGRRPVGAVDEEGPVEPAADQRQPVAKRREPRLVVARGTVRRGRRRGVTPVSGSRNSMRPVIGEGLLDRVDDLDEMGARAGRDDRVERRLDLVDRVEEVADQDHVGEAAERAGIGLRPPWPRAPGSRRAARRRCARGSGCSRRGGRRARRPRRGARRARGGGPCARSRLVAGASRERKSIEAERSTQSQTVWAASHSFSRT